MFKIYVTSTTLNGKLHGLDVEEGSESQSKLLEAFSAWVMEDEDDEVSEDDFLFTHVSSKLFNCRLNLWQYKYIPSFNRQFLF